jgi:hypothetical protein
MLKNRSKLFSETALKMEAVGLLIIAGLHDIKPQHVAIFQLKT